MQTLLEAKGVKHVLESIGNEHKYQIKIVLLIALQYLFRSFFMIYFAFIAQAPTFECTHEDGSPYDCYENNGGCIEQKFSPNSPSSLAIDVGLYCDQAYYRSLGSSVFFLGGNIGVAIFSKISDDYGRKPAMVYSYAVGAASLLLLGIATVGPWSYLLFLMMIWGGMSCFLAISLTYVAEFSSEKFARTASAALLLSIVIAELIIIFLAYFITSWKVLYLTCIGIPAVVTLISFQYMDETPFFLYGKKQVNKTIEVLQKVAITNEKPLPIENNIQAEAVVNAAKKVEDETVQQVKKWNYWEILVHPKLTMRVLIYSGIRLYLCMAFWGCIFSLSSLGGSITTNSAIAAVAEGLGYLLSMKAHLFQTRILLKGSLSIVMIMGFSFMLVPILECDSSFICSRLFLQGVLSLVMRTAVCFVYGFIYSVGNELFPPEVRSQSNGIAGVASDAGGMVTPFVLLFAQAVNLNPLLVLGVIGAIPLVASQYLAEDEITSLEEVSPGTEMKYMKMTDQEQPQTE